METAQNAPEQKEEAPKDSYIQCVDASLLSSEKLDRASPELWPEQLPGMWKFAPKHLTNQPPPSWNTTLTEEDLKYIRQLDALPINSLFAEVKNLCNSAYRLGVEESKEMTRARYLNIFSERSE